MSNNNTPNQAPVNSRSSSPGGEAKRAAAEAGLDKDVYSEGAKRREEEPSDTKESLTTAALMVQAALSDLESWSVGQSRGA